MGKYTQEDKLPRVSEYLNMRLQCGLSPKSADAAAMGLPNSLFATCIRVDGDLVGMGRVVGDGGCNFEVVDVAVHPGHQRQGLGHRIMEAIMRYVARNAPDSAYVSLIADHESPALYRKYGFKPTSPVSIGMAFRVTKRET